MKTFTLLTILATLFILTSTRIMHEESQCGHKHFKEEPPIRIDVDEQPLFTKGEDTRLLATKTYPNIRIATDFSLLTDGTADFKSYVQYQLIPPVVDYFKAALTVKQPLTTPLKLPSGYKTICGYKTPQTLLNGGQY